MAKYRTKVEFVSALQLTDEALDASYPNSDLHIKGVIYDPIQRCAFIVRGRSGRSTRVWVGDWIIRGAGGELSKCEATDFPGRYEPITTAKYDTQAEAALMDKLVAATAAAQAADAELRKKRSEAIEAGRAATALWAKAHAVETELQALKEDE